MVDEYNKRRDALSQMVKDGLILDFKIDYIIDGETIIINQTILPVTFPKNIKISFSL